MNRPLSASAQHTSDAIAEARIRYALERLDYHDHFPRMTVPEIQRALADEEPGSERRASIVRRLLLAQQSAPHDLWVLLLVVAMDGVLAQRREDFYALKHPWLAGLVLKSFIAALQDIPHDLPAGRILTYVLRFSEAILRQTALRGMRVNPGSLRQWKGVGR